jgi:phosphoglycerate dehydrogenase-like enzyme
VATRKLVVCLEFTPFHAARFVDRLHALPGVEPLILPIDPGGSAAGVDSGLAQPEPPSWATSVAEERRAVLARANLLVALHAPEHLTDLAPELHWIQSIGAGVEQFARAGVTRDLVVVTNASGVSAPSMSEWVIGRLLQVWKHSRRADAYQQKHEYHQTYGRTFAGSTIGIVGLGNIGVEVAKRVRALGCRVLAMKRSAGPGATSEHADALYSPERLHELLAECDAVVISAPATPETHHLIDAKALEAMKPSAVLVNVARGSLVDEVALAETMRQGKLGAAVLDVFDQEPLPGDSPLWDLPGVYISAHSSVSIDRYLDDVFDLVHDNVERWTRQETLRNVVDMETLGFA